MVNQQNDHYEMLGVSRQASPDQIRNRYRELARRQHPDTAGVNGLLAFQELTHAYHVLQDPRRRAEYDATLQATSPLQTPPKRPVGKSQDPAALLRSPAMHRLLSEAEGDALVETGQREEALASYRSALGQNPNPPLEAKIARLTAEIAGSGRTTEPASRPINSAPKSEYDPQPFWRRWLGRDRASGQS